MQKVAAYMKLEGEKFKIADLTLSFREYFPGCMKYLKDFYNLKFKKQ